ncbi:MAG: hypothetical protein Q4P15_00545 [Propionibacteriaceae bacterium]|nr:hypothetical protein [Propionibacteriaceae bacterium]
MDDTDDENVEAKRRWPWFAAGGLLFVSAALSAVSVYLLWLPCRGVMWDGTIFAPSGEKDISDACLRRMDEGFPLVYFPQDVGLTPSASQVGGLAMVVAVAAWILLVLGLRLRAETTLIALLAAIAPLIFAILSWSAALNPGDKQEDYITGWLWIAVDVAALVLYCILWWRNPALPRETLLGLGFVLWGATSFGFAHLLVDFQTMVLFNEFNWDVPPGTGWLTVAVLVIAGAVAVWTGGRRRELPAESSPSRFAAQ